MNLTIDHRTTPDAAAPTEVFRELLARFENHGGRAGLAKALDITPQQISQFLTGYRQRVPAWRICEAVESITGGTVPAVWVRRGRPDISDRCLYCGR